MSRCKICGKKAVAVFEVVEVIGRAALCHYCILESGYKMQKVGKAMVDWAEGRAEQAGWKKIENGF